MSEPMIFRDRGPYIDGPEDGQDEPWCHLCGDEGEIPTRVPSPYAQPYEPCPRCNPRGKW